MSNLLQAVCAESLLVAGGVSSVCRADAMHTYPVPGARRPAHAVASFPCSTMFLGCLNACLVQPVISVERGVFYRERAAGYYAALPVSPSWEWQIMLPTLCAATWSGRSLMPQLPKRLPTQPITSLPKTDNLPFSHAVLGGAVPDRGALHAVHGHLLQPHRLLHDR